MLLNFYDIHGKWHRVELVVSVILRQTSDALMSCIHKEIEKDHLNLSAQYTNLCTILN